MSRFLQRLAQSSPLVYDGGFGSQLFARGIELTNSALANESHPDAVVDIHKTYIASGADIIGTNTFVASELHLEMAGKEPDAAAELSRQAAAHARRAVEESQRPAFIAGSVGPSPGAIEADSGDTDFGIANDRVRLAHRRVIEALADGGIDFFVVETMFSAKEAAIIVDEARATGLPIVVNMTFKYTKDRKSGQIIYKTDWGHSAADLIAFLADGEFSGGEDLLPHVQAVGLNCGAESRRDEHTGMPYAIEGTRQLLAALAERGVDGKRIMAYPNAGRALLERGTQKTYYAQTPADMAARIGDLLDAGAFMVGGCCGTGPEHIAAFRQAVDARSGSA